MVWLVHLRRYGALMAIGGGVMLMSAPAISADLDYDYPRQGSYKDYWGDREPEPRYTERHDSRCVPRHVVRKRLIADGWRDFDRAEPRGPYVIVDAHRQSGRPFRLRIDRCSGDVVLAKPLAPPRHARGRHWRDETANWRDDRPRWRRWADRGPRRERIYDRY